MKQKISEYIAMLTDCEEVQAYENLLNLSKLKKISGSGTPMTMNSDGSRNFDDSIVVTAFEFGGGLIKISYYYTESGKFSTYSYQMPDGKSHTLFHSHNFMEIAYVAEGTLKLSVNGSIAEFNEGDICIMDYNTMHAEVIGEEIVKVLYLSISPDVFTSLMNADNTSSEEEVYLKSIVIEKKNAYQYVRFLPSEDTSKSHSAILSILYETAGRQPGARDIIKGNITRLSHLLTSEYTLRLSNVEKAQARRRLYADVTSYIKDHSRDLKIEDLISRFHYNKDFFNRLIKEFSGMTYTEYLQSERLKAAEKLLKSTSLTISAVADRVGYQNLGYFYKIFGEKYGMLPTEYRRK